MTKQMFLSLLVIAFLALLNAGTVYAQGTTSLGLRGGLNLASLAFKNSDYKMKAGANFGAFATRSLEEHWGVTGEINFTQKGAKFDLPTAGSTLTYSYLEIPVYGTYYFLGQESPFRPKIFVGPTVGILMTAKSKVSGLTTDIKESTNTVDVGVVGGLGFNYRLTEGGNWLYFDARYNYGTSDLIKDNNGDALTNRVLSFNLGISFPLD